MKAACSSSAFHALFRSGDLTQLEWIDLCANELAADGVVFDVRHFPRTDADYLAQLKKTCVDVGLTVAAIYDEALFRSGDTDVQRTFALASDLGAPLVAAPLQPQTEMPWIDVLERLNDITALAKRQNITVAVRNAPHSFASGTHEYKRVAKETDSAWLRFAPRFATLDAGSNPQDLLVKTVLVWADVEDTPQLDLLSRYRGFAAIDAHDGDARIARVGHAIAAWRGVLEVNRT